MTGATIQSIVIPETRVYDTHRKEDTILRNVSVNMQHEHDNKGNVMYFDLDEAKAYLDKQGRSLASLPLLVNLYISLSDLAEQDELAAQLYSQFNNVWDRTGTSISTDGRIVHNDVVLGETIYGGLKVPQEAGAIDHLFGKNEQFFQALLGVRDIDKLIDIATRQDLVPFYWYPRGERLVMFGGGDFYYMHQHIPGLLMVFCDDEPQPRRVARGIWVEK